jgi:hypothetical protein
MHAAVLQFAHFIADDMYGGYYFCSARLQAAQASTSCPLLLCLPPCCPPRCLQDIVETPAAFELHCDAPGFSPDDVAVEMNEGVITISGKRKEEKREEKDGKVRLGVRLLLLLLLL